MRGNVFRVFGAYGTEKDFKTLKEATKYMEGNPERTMVKLRERRRYYVNNGVETLIFDDRERAYRYYNMSKKKARDKRFITIRSKKILVRPTV